MTFSSGYQFPKYLFNFVLCNFCALTDMARTRGASSQPEGRRRPTTSVCRGDRGASSSAPPLLLLMLLILVV